MNKKLSLAVASAVMAFGASAANAGIVIPAGDWTVDIGGNVNAYYTHTKTSGAGAAQAQNTIGTGLLPSALGIGAKTRQNDLDIAVQFTFFTGSSSGNNAAGGSNTLNIRQAFLTFGDKSWGTIKAGRDLGIFGSDAILSDQTLLGVGVGGPAGGSSTLGRIGSGYIYADWVGQISYWSPNWNGFSFGAGVREPWTNAGSVAGVAQGDVSKNDMGFEGKASYEFSQSDVTGKVWVGGITQKHQAGVATAGYTSKGWELGGKVGYSGAELVGYYYSGDGLDSKTSVTGLVSGLAFLGGNKSDDDGGYVQVSYKIPGVGTKLAASWGESNTKGVTNAYDIENRSWIIGAYHPLTKSLNLVAEYTDQRIEDSVANLQQKNKTTSLGAILFF